MHNNNKAGRKTKKISLFPCILCKTDKSKRHIDYFSKGPKSSRTDRARERRSFRVNSTLLIIKFFLESKLENPGGAF